MTHGISPPAAARPGPLCEDNIRRQNAHWSIKGSLTCRVCSFIALLGARAGKLACLEALLQSVTASASDDRVVVVSNRSATLTLASAVNLVSHLLPVPIVPSLAI